MNKTIQKTKMEVECPKCHEKNLITETTALLNGFSWWNCLKCGHKGNSKEFLK